MSTPFNVGTSRMHPTRMHNDTDGGDDEVQENSDEDESEQSDDVLQENSMQVAKQDLDTDQVENVHDNNEYVELTDPHFDKFEDDDWVTSTRVEHITYEFNRSKASTDTDDLKVGDIFDSKVKMLKQLPNGSLLMECHSRL